MTKSKPTNGKTRSKAEVLQDFRPAARAGEPAAALVDELDAVEEAANIRQVTILFAELRELCGALEDDILEGSLMNAANVPEVFENASQAERRGAEALARAAIAAVIRARTTANIFHWVRREQKAQA
jgi:hypothetical protein